MYWVRVAVDPGKRKGQESVHMHTLATDRQSVCVCVCVCVESRPEDPLGCEHSAALWPESRATGMKMGMFAVRSTGIIELKHVFCRYSIPLVLFKRAFSFVILWSTKRDVCPNVHAAHLYSESGQGLKATKLWQELIKARIKLFIRLLLYPSGFDNYSLKLNVTTKPVIRAHFWNWDLYLIWKLNK